MNNLPINRVLQDVKLKLQKYNKLVLQAPAGAGKTTALPLALLDEPWLEGKQIIMLEPRRLAVRSSASRMAELLGESVGQRIGYQIKMDSKKSKDTKILIVTEGILTRKLQQDPSLEGVALVIFDEFHERSLHADLSLALSLETQSLLRDDLKILIMSATLNTSAIAKLLDDAPIIMSEGRSFAIESNYLPTSIKQPTKKELPTYIYRLIEKILKEQSGSILVFLSGVREIKAIEKLLKATKRADVYISTLYGNLSKEEQDRAIKAPKDGARKVVLSTNIAQTSLTIEGIKVVIDSGLHNVLVFNSFTGMNSLETIYISKDSAIQRAGRAGRLSAGKAYHIWHKSKVLIEHDVPEILLADLSSLVLELAVWGCTNISDLMWMDLPPPIATKHAKNLLVELGALDENGTITSHGRAMNSYPMHPRLAHMMLKSKELGFSYEASLLAVLLNEKEIYANSFNSSDLKERVETLHNIAQKNMGNLNHVNIKQCHYILKSAKQIEAKQKANINLDILGVLLAFAYPDRIAMQRLNDRSSYLLSNGKGALLHNEDELFKARFLVVADLGVIGRISKIYKAIELSRSSIDAYLAKSIVTKQKVEWSDEEARVKVFEVTSLGAITLEKRQIKVDSENEEVLEVFLAELEALGLEVLKFSSKVKNLRDRVNFVNHNGLDFPDFSDEYLLENLDEWLAPYLDGIYSLKACQNLDFYNILLGLMSFKQSQELEKLAPQKLKVASGSQIAIDYSNIEQPILAVKLQEMFGTKSTPTVLNSKVKLLIHLLSPASRPMQVTQDLESFWTNSYSEVRKELRGKYKKHYWPTNPLEAKATSKVKRLM